MALLLPRSVFYHIPKTGGSWVREAVRSAGIPAQEIGNLHATPQEAGPQGRLAFTFVRDPLTWYPSYWMYQMRMAWDLPNSALGAFRSDDFGSFMRRVLRKRPGFLSKLYGSYVGLPFHPVQFIGRQENLAEDLIHALRLAGERFDERRILSTPPRNSSRIRPVLSGSLQEAVSRSELPAMETFGYLPGSRPLSAAPAAQILHRRLGQVRAGVVSPARQAPWVGASARGTSMLPFFRPQEDVWHERIPPSSLRLGDVVAFRSRKGGLATHRLVRIVSIDGELAFVTKGDRNLQTDPLVFSDQIVGRVVRVGSKDLDRLFWRAAGGCMARVSYAQAVLYHRLANGVLNRLRHRWERSGKIPRVRLRGLFRSVTSPWSWWTVVQAMGGK